MIEQSPSQRGIYPTPVEPDIPGILRSGFKELGFSEEESTRNADVWVQLLEMGLSAKEIALGSNEKKVNALHRRLLGGLTGLLEERESGETVWDNFLNQPGVADELRTGAEQIQRRQVTEYQPSQ